MPNDVGQVLSVKIKTSKTWHKIVRGKSTNDYKKIQERKKTKEFKKNRKFVFAVGCSRNAVAMKTGF